jgi:hypothetical protein
MQHTRGHGEGCCEDKRAGRAVAVAVLGRLMVRQGRGIAGPQAVMQAPVA